MKMLKRLAAAALAACTALALSGCAGSGKNGNSSAPDNSDTGDDLIGDLYAVTNSTVKIYNAADEEIGSFDCYNYSALADGSVLYTKLPDGVSDEENVREFHLYNIEKAEDHKLGTVEDCRYTASYETVEADGHLYISIASGEYGVRENSKITIYDIDLSEYSMSPILEVEGGIPYNSYTIVNNKLILAELLYNGHTDIIEYDLNEKRSSPVVHAYDETDYFTKDSIRHIYADGDKIYMMRLGLDDYALYLDAYDLNYDLINSINVCDFCVSTDFERTEDSKINEWKQFIAYFFVHNDLVYYQNFSTTNAIGVMESGKVDRLFEIDSGFRYVQNTEKRGSDLFIQVYDMDKGKRNTFYLVDPETGEVRTARFYAPDTRYDFFSALWDGDKILLNMGHVQYDENDVRLPKRLYYLDINDLDFKAAE